MPSPVQLKSLTSPSMTAYIMTQKYVDRLPLYRIEKQFERFGLSLSRQTMANWLLHGADQWLSPLYKRMHDFLIKQLSRIFSMRMRQPCRSYENQVV